MEIYKLYSRLENKQKALFITKLILRLTVFARDTYKINSDGVEYPDRLRMFNELYQTLSGQLCSVLSNDKDCYPDEIFINIVFDKAEYTGMLDHISKAIKEELDRII